MRPHWFHCSCTLPTPKPKPGIAERATTAKPMDTGLPCARASVSQHHRVDSLACLLPARSVPRLDTKALPTLPHHRRYLGSMELETCSEPNSPARRRQRRQKEPDKAAPTTPWLTAAQGYSITLQAWKRGLHTRSVK
eukprot:TRINITY_DN33836_c0_g1_i1.p1 TRINITY_DN33836_c0_g1~~TRINITY_DN33836_c0_g1_i1.p1  ORF type:complete len:137 (+),score=13.16 TRINITY_DN33836_c0_g1_i1:53-463(+)